MRKLTSTLVTDRAFRLAGCKWELDSSRRLCRVLSRPFAASPARFDARLLLLLFLPLPVVAAAAWAH